MFPGASSERADADYAIIGAPLDVSSSFRPGARFGPRRIREFATPFEDYDHHTDRRFTALRVHDHGDVRAWDDAPDYLEHLEGVISDVAREGAIPIVLGGEHTVTAAAVRALEPTVFLSLDAHLDLREAYDGNPWSHATVTRHALSVADEAVVLGARAGSEAGWERAGRDDVTVVSPGEVGSWSPPTGESLYVSVDVDVVDPGYAPGTGTPEPFGCPPSVVRDVVRASAPTAVGFDVVEVTDRDDGQAASLGAKLVREFVFGNAATR